MKRIDNTRTGPVTGGIKTTDVHSVGYAHNPKQEEQEIIDNL